MSCLRCWSSDTYNPAPGVMPNVPASRGYTGGFAVALMRKDLTLAVEAANNAKAPVPLGAAAHQLYSLLAAQGYDLFFIILLFLCCDILESNIDCFEFCLTIIRYDGKDFSSVFEYLSVR